MNDIVVVGVVIAVVVAVVDVDRVVVSGTAKTELYRNYCTLVYCP